jgi:hypothetical protein
MTVHKLQAIRLSVLVCAGTFALAGCEQASTQDNETRLVYLAPQMPCEMGEPSFGQPNCLIRRKRDAVAVLRVPKDYGGNAKQELPERFSSTQILIEPNGVLAMGQPGRTKEFVEKSRAESKKGPTTDKSDSVYMGVGWGWRYPSVVDGQAGARDSMDSWYKNIGSQAGNEDLNYVEIASPVPGFKAYAMKRCVGHYARISSTKGTLSPKSSCDVSDRYYLPLDDEKTSVQCNSPFMLDDKINEGLYCRMQSSFTLHLVDGKPFNIYYTYSPTWEHMKSGHWKYLNQRFEAWVKSMDVTDQELSRSKK